MRGRAPVDRRSALAAWLLRITGVALFATGPAACGDTARPAIDYRIEGVVSDAEGPIQDFPVRLDRIDLDLPEYYRTTVRTDSTGFFTAWVPEGDYRVSIRLDTYADRPVYWSASGLRPLEAQADPVAVRAGHNVGRLDCRLGGFDLAVETGPEREGTVLLWSLRTPVLDDPIYEAESVVRGGVARLVGRRIPPGDYRLRLKDGTAPHESADIVISQPGGLGTASLVRIGRDAYAQYTYDFLPRAEVTFQVESDIPRGDISRLRLVLHDADLDPGEPAFLEWEAPIDAEGRVVVPVAFPRALRTQVAWILADDTLSRSLLRWIDSDTRSEALVRQVIPGQTTEAIVTSGRTLEIHLDRPERMESTFTAGLALTNAAGDPVDGIEFPNLGEGGSIRFHNLLPGSYLLRLFAEDTPFLTQWYATGSDVAETRDGATPIEVAATGPVTRVSWQPSLGATVSGRILGSDGLPLANDTVFLTSDRGRGIAAALGRTDANGEFRGEGIAHGRYKLGASGSPTTLWYPGVASWDSAAVLVLDEFRDYEGFEMMFGSAGKCAP